MSGDTRQRLADYLAHDLEAIERIDRYTTGMDLSAFAKLQMNFLATIGQRHDPALNESHLNCSFFNSCRRLFGAG